MSYAPTVKERQSSSSTTGKKTHSYNNNHHQPARKSSNSNSQRQHDTWHYQTPISSIQDISKSIRPVSSTNNSNNSLLQPKLRISQPGDVYEQEADRIAEKMTSMPSIPLSYSAVPQIGGRSNAKSKGIDKKCSACEMKGKEEEEEKEELKISRKPSAASSSSVEASDQATNEIKSMLSGSGSPLDANTKEFMESRFGYDLSNVRIHTDAGAARSAESVNALAYTGGNDIAFANGQYHPDTLQGRRLLAHELVHVIQQRNGLGPSEGIQRQPSGLPVEERIRNLVKNAKELSERATNAAARLVQLEKEAEWYSSKLDVSEDVIRQRNAHKYESANSVLDDVQREADELISEADALKRRIGGVQGGYREGVGDITRIEVAQNEAIGARTIARRRPGGGPKLPPKPSSGSGGGEGGGKPSSGGSHKLESGAEGAAAKEIKAAGAAEEVTKFGGLGLKTEARLMKIGAFIEGFLPGPLEVLDVAIAFFGTIAEGAEQKREEYYARGFSKGLAASLCGFPEKWARYELSNRSISPDIGEMVAGYEGIKERANNKGVIDGWKYGHNLSDGHRHDYRAKGFAAMAKKEERFSLNENDISLDDVKNLGRALEPMVQHHFEVVRQREEARRRAAQAKRWEEEFGRMSDWDKLRLGTI